MNNSAAASVPQGNGKANWEKVCRTEAAAVDRIPERTVPIRIRFEPDAEYLKREKRLDNSAGYRQVREIFTAVCEKLNSFLHYRHFPPAAAFLKVQKEGIRD